MARLAPALPGRTGSIHHSQRHSLVSVVLTMCSMAGAVQEASAHAVGHAAENVVKFSGFVPSRKQTQPE